jgi:hypothetical protein
VTRRTDRQKLLAQKLRLARETSLPTVAPETVAGILRAEAARPMRGGALDMPHRSLFGDAHLQRELF